SQSCGDHPKVLRVISSLQRSEHDLGFQLRSIPCEFLRSQLRVILCLLFPFSTSDVQLLTFFNQRCRRKSAIAVQPTARHTQSPALQSPKTCPTAIDIASQSPSVTAAPFPARAGSPVLLLHSATHRGTTPISVQPRSSFLAGYPPRASETCLAAPKTPRSWPSFSRRPSPYLRGRVPLCSPSPAPTAKSSRKRR